MSTVVITPTHIACDHNVVHTLYPHTTAVDLTYRKLFMPPDRRFVIGLVGEFSPSKIDTEETYKAFDQIIQELSTQLNTPGLEFDTSAFFNMNPFIQLEKVVDVDGRIFIVTKTLRYIVFRTKESKRWGAKHLSAYAGIGSGGMIAAGLLIGGMALGDIWEPLHAIDTLSSVEHTSIPLSSLKPWKAAK
jgi:hypothetical protein